jgi:hypothetical protein
MVNCTPVSEEAEITRHSPKFRGVYFLPGIRLDDSHRVGRKRDSFPALLNWFAANRQANLLSIRRDGFPEGAPDSFDKVPFQDRNRPTSDFGSLLAAA